MNYFLDTEFTQLPWDGEPELISIGIVDEDDREYYAYLDNFDEDSVSEFVRENVLPFLPDASKRKSVSTVTEEVYDFISKATPSNFWCLHPSEAELNEWGFSEDRKKEIMEKYGDIDVQLPKALLADRWPDNWPQHGTDLIPLVDKLEQSNEVPENEQIHNALADARWNKAVWERAVNLN